MVVALHALKITVREIFVVFGSEHLQVFPLLSTKARPFPIRLTLSVGSPKRPGHLRTQMTVCTCRMRTHIQVDV